ncbi:hypothetical protein YGS_C3P0161 (plasmid) [Sphingobium sp. YG1]|nr:hypothetical protein YGS_C3P0161 [Sphingobium sp. YG1]
MAVGSEVSNLLDACPSRLVHAEVGEEAMKVGNLALTAEKPRDPALMVFKKHR